MKARLDAICTGAVGTVKTELEAISANAPHDRVRRFLEYLIRFAEAVDDQYFTEQSDPIGSGEVERAHKTIPQKRLKLAGACWHPDSINPMVALRIVRANEWWEDFWKGRIEEKLMVILPLFLMRQMNDTFPSEGTENGSFASNMKVGARRVG